MLSETSCDIDNKIIGIDNQPNTSTNSSPARGFSSNGSSSSLGESTKICHLNDNISHKNDQNISTDISSINKTFPWVRKEYEPSIQGLDDELNDLCDFLKPTNNERIVRYKIFNEVRSVLQTTFELCEVLPYGSMASELFLPSSDIDIVCFMKSYIPDHLNIAAEAFSKSIHLEVVKKIEGATVPIIKLRNNATQIMIDVSFDTHNVLPTVDFLLRIKQRNPKLAPLALILKQLLQDHNLNTNTDGGLSSYAIVLLVIRLLQAFPRNDTCYENFANDNNTLAHYFLKFLEYYGMIFNYDENAIRVRDDGAILTKQEMFREMNSMDILDHSLLVLEDPIMPHKDVCKNSYRFAAIKNLWKSMFITFNNIFENGFSKEDNYFGVSKSFFVKFMHLRRCTPEIRSIIEKANGNLQGDIGSFPIPYSANGQFFSFPYNQIYPPPFTFINQCVPGMQIPYNSYAIPVGYVPIQMYNTPPPNGVPFTHQVPNTNAGAPMYPTHFLMHQQLIPGAIIYTTNIGAAYYANNSNVYPISNQQGQSTVTSEIEVSDDKDSFSNSESDDGKDQEDQE